MTPSTKTLSGWGRYPQASCALKTPRTSDQLADDIKSSDKVIARGNGRSYGDAAFSRTATISMLRFNRMIAFDAQSGELTCEAGVLLKDILDTFVPRGWFPAVTPGTKFVTLGGMIASDVHGKNHHKDGAFGRHVLWFDLITADGTTTRCSSQENANLFNHTVGGMGLTGVIIRCCIRLRRINTAYIREKRIVANNLADVVDAFSRSEDWTYSVAWIDCLASGAKLGRSVLYLGEHAEIEDLPLQIHPLPLTAKTAFQAALPVTPPFSVLNRLSVQAFNELYFQRAKIGANPRILDYNAYFYPLDFVRQWNRAYGPRGFVQYQCVLPLEESLDGLTQILETTSGKKMGSFLAVLKLFGEQSGVLSFPTRGYTLTLDFPWSRKTALLLDELDQIVKAHGGHVYLAKDARLSPEIFADTQPNLTEFREQRRHNGSNKKFSSLQSERLGL